MGNAAETSQQYRAALSKGAIYSPNNRSLIEVTGRDRHSWLNNLVTNSVKDLQPGQGAYAFAINLQGRTIFDANILALEERLWLDVDARWLDKILGHLNRYIITEDVTVSDRSAQVGRVAIIGPQAEQVSISWGAVALTSMLPLQNAAITLGTSSVRIVRNDFTGLVTADLFLSDMDAGGAQIVAARLANEYQLPMIEDAAVRILRIEAGVPASIDDIDADVIPPETGQIERGINYRKGCYLGQEVIERMRSHGVLARRLVGMTWMTDAREAVPKDSQVKVEDRVVGRVTSSCWSEHLVAPLALGYVKTTHSESGTEIAIESEGRLLPGRIVGLPVRPKPASQ